jgi:hypothetical protein
VSSTTRLAEIDLGAAECALAHAGRELQVGEVKKAAAKLATSDSYLRRALDNLLKGRRNVVWSREYCRLRAQYKVDRNLCRLIDLHKRWNKLREDKKRTPVDGHGDRTLFQEEQSFWRYFKATLPQYVRTLRQGFLLVGAGHDLELEAEPDKQSPWLRQTHRELVFVGTRLVAVLFLCLEKFVLRFESRERRSPAELFKDVLHYVGNLATVSKIEWDDSMPKEDIWSAMQKEVEEGSGKLDEGLRDHMLSWARKAARR